jgi:hypothetical protein
MVKCGVLFEVFVNVSVFKWYLCFKGLAGFLRYIRKTHLSARAQTHTHTRLRISQQTSFRWTSSTGCTRPHEQVPNKASWNAITENWQPEFQRRGGGTLLHLNDGPTHVKTKSSATGPSASDNLEKILRHRFESALQILNASFSIYKELRPDEQSRHFTVGCRTAGSLFSQRLAALVKYPVWAAGPCNSPQPLTQLASTLWSRRRTQCLVKGPCGAVDDVRSTRNSLPRTETQDLSS